MPSIHLPLLIALLAIFALAACSGELDRCVSDNLRVSEGLYRMQGVPEASVDALLRAREPISRRMCESVLR